MAVCTLCDLFDKCSFIIDAKQCYLPDLLRDNAAFIIDNFTRENSRQICLHAGTEFLPIVTSLICGLYCLANNEQTPEATLNALSSGSYVIYNGSRGVFHGFDDEGRAIVKQANSLTNYIPKSKFYLVKPYYGSAQALDGRGVRGVPALNCDFLSAFMGVDKSELPTQITESFVIVADRALADAIMKRTVIKEPSGITIPLGYFFPSAYYTESDIYHYAGNVSKAEPMLKFTSRISVARELIIDDTERNISGLIVSGQSVIESGESELVSLMNRRSLKHICVLDKINGWNAVPFLKQFPDTELFAWTKKLLSQYAATSNNTFSGESGSLSDALSRLISNFCEAESRREYIGEPIGSELFFSIKKALWNIARFGYADPNKESFVIIGFSLLKLFTFSIFSMRQLESAIAAGAVSVRSPSEQLDKLKILSSKFAGALGDAMETVYLGLCEFYESICYENGKFNYIFDQLLGLENNQYADIVVPKGYFGTVFSLSFQEKNKTLLKRLRFVTPGRYERDSLDGKTIFVGAFKGKHFNPCACEPGGIVTTIMYEFEDTAFSALIRETRAAQSYYDARNSITAVETTEYVQEAMTQELNVEADLEEYIRTITIKHAVGSAGDNTGLAQHITPVYRIITFESGEIAFLTRNYVAYSFDEVTETVVDKNVADLLPGDYLVFTSHGDKTRDIVAEALKILIASDSANSSLAETYEKSQEWKLVLKRHMDAQGLSFKDVSKQMAEMGHTKHEVTIRSWLNEESHIVGPRDLDSFVAIALVTGNDEMSDNPNAYWDACNLIRSTRMRILKYIGLSIINSLGQRRKKTDEALSSVIGDISSLARVLQIESILEPDGLSVPSYLFNRPQEQ